VPLPEPVVDLPQHGEGDRRDQAIAGTQGKRRSYPEAHVEPIPLRPVVEACLVLHVREVDNVPVSSSCRRRGNGGDRHRPHHVVVTGDILAHLSRLRERPRDAVVGDRFKRFPRSCMGIDSCRSTEKPFPKNATKAAATLMIFDYIEATLSSRSAQAAGNNLVQSPKGLQSRTHTINLN
jgi:hypothetical protein